MTTVETVNPGPQAPGLGRIYAPDPQDAKYRMRSIVRAADTGPLRSRHWLMGRGMKLCSQGYVPHCVRFNETHLLQFAPVVRGNAFTLTEGMHEWSTANDEFPSGAEGGTSLRAGFEFLRMRGLISAYHWAFTMDEIRARVTSDKADGGGPMVAGTLWTTGMDRRDANGYWWPTGGVRGGHCWGVSGYSRPTIKRTGRYKTFNSHEGNYTAWIEEDALEWLLFAADGEAAAVVEVPR